jgi:undecaprenyl-diphosphatase
MQELLWNIDAFDRAVVVFFAENMQHPWASAFFHFITNSSNWRIPLAAVWLGLLIFGGRKGRICALLMLPLFFLSDFCTAKIIKPLFGRWRPLGHFGLSFPSVHATNSFAIVTLISLFFRRKGLQISLYTMAVLVAFSRLYIGVHYPTDILAGAILGVVDALIIYYAWRRLERWWKYDKLLLPSERLPSRQ